jgi:di/tricarboxylate transporter
VGETPTNSRVSRYLPIVVLAAVVAALWLVSGGDPKTKTLIDAALLVGFAIACWAFGWLAEPATTLVFFLLVVLFHVAKPEVVFSGFASSAWWLVLGGSITAIAVQTTGLGRRLAGLLLGRAAGSYPRAVAAVALAAVGLAFLMPSTNGRIMLLMPIVLAFADRLGLSPGRVGYTGLVLTVAAASYMPPTTILPANVPNGILLGAAESLYGVKLAYGPYLLLHFPILGALKTVALIWLVCWLFREREGLRPSPIEDLGPMSPEERRLAWLLALSLLLFATDFIHGISPAWVSLGTGLLCFLPPLGLITPEVFSARINVVMLVYIAGILGLGAVVADSGLSAWVSEHLLAWASLTPGHDVRNVAMLSAIGAGLAALTTATGVPAVLTPLAQEFATASGLPLLTVLMLQVVPFSTVFLPFESPPMMVAMQLGGVGVRPASKLCLALAAVTLLALLPLDYLWWQLLGYLP